MASKNAKGLTLREVNRAIKAGLTGDGEVVVTNTESRHNLAVGLNQPGKVVLDGEEQDVRPGTMVHIPPGVVHGAVGKMRVLVVGIPDIDDSDVYYVDD